MPAIVNGLSFDVEDWFQVENLKGMIRPADWDDCELRVEANTRRILELLSSKGVQATFFILGWVARRCPGLVREIAQGGHEIASHGWGHELIYRLTPPEFAADVTRAKGLLEDLSGQEVLGYRAPSFSITKDSLWALDVLKESGYAYDSSIFPISFHDRYGFAAVGLEPFTFANGLWEAPISHLSLAGLRLPLGGGAYFRHLPYAYFKLGFKWLNYRKLPFVFYFHPWEIDFAQPRVRLPLKYQIRHYGNLRRAEGKLKALLNDFQFQRLKDLLHLA